MERAPTGHRLLFNCLKSPSFQWSSLFVQQLLSTLLLLVPVELNKVDRNTVIVVDMSPQAVHQRLEKITDSLSPPSPSRTQKCNIQEINEDNHHQTHKIYNFENCDTVYIDSLNAHNVRMKNCGNNDITKVTSTCSLFSLLSLFFLSNLAILLRSPS